MLVLMDHEENKTIELSIAYKPSFLATVFCTDVEILMEA
jgi:DNA phosphorothioation-dependent restriction protein DptG